MVKNVSILVTGNVQGVFFRASAKAKADELGIFGFVRNQPSGQVFIEAEGEENQIALFENWCKEGPPMAHVYRLEVSEGEVKQLRDFTIRR